jgi:hypothetical protein
MNGPETRPVNIGSAHEFTILDFAEAVRVSVANRASLSVLNPR